MLNNSIISLIVLRYNMGRKYQGPALYWRILVDGKYTWKKAIDVGNDADGFICVIPLEESE